jgi:hypothetical protein
MRLFIGQKLSLLIEFADSGAQPALRPRVAASGVVNRVQALDDGSFRFAADFTGYRFL